MDIQSILQPFADTLQSKLSKFLGLTKLPSYLELDVPTLISVLLIAERYKEIQYDPSVQCFTRESIAQEFIDLGLPGELSVDSIIEELLNRDLVSLSDQGFIEPKSNMVEAIKVLEKTFPRMAGISMIAYLVQTIEEVLSGRKAHEFAVKQFSDTLEIYGEPKTDKAKRSKGHVTKHKTQASEGNLPKAGSDDTTVSNSAAVLARLKAAAKAQATSGSSHIISGMGESKVEIRTFEMADLFADSEPPEQDKTSHLKAAIQEPDSQNDQEALTENYDNSCDIGNTNEEKTLEGSIPEDFHEHDLSTNDFIPSEPSIPSESHSAEHTPSILSEPATQPRDLGESEESDFLHQNESVGIQQQDPPVQEQNLSEDDEIDKKIAAFEDELSLLCPLCGKGRVEERTTTSGRKFYQCSLENCTFISWGKPIHTPCPICKNTFLVEVTDSSGNTMLKCPRATCGFKGRSRELIGEKGPSARLKPLSGLKPTKRSKKRLVRRRVVRRKR